MPGDGVAAFESSGLGWRAEADSADVVRREVADRIDRLAEIPGAVVLKRNMVRTVWRVPLSDGRRVVVKRFRVEGVRDWIKYSVRNSRALTEWNVGRALDAAGIPTAVPLAWAERRSGGVLRDAALVTREIGDAVHLNAWVDAHLCGPAAAARRAALFGNLARLVRRMHDAGFVHNDFHGGNLLVNGPPDAPTIHVIDLHTVTRPARPSDGARWFDLVKLLHSLHTGSAPQERVEICKAYEAAGTGPSGTRVARLLAEGSLSGALETEIAAMERRRVRSRTDRSLRRSSKFDIARHGAFRVHHLRTVDPQAVLAAVEAHRATLAAGGPRVLKDGSRSGITRQTLATAAGPRAVVVKEYRGAGVIDRAKNAVRTPRAVAAWVAGHGLLVRGFDAAEPLALVLHGRGAAMSRSWLVMEDLGDGTRADLVALARYAGDIGRERRAEKLRVVLGAADLVRRLHAAGVYHGDLKAVNLFLRGEPGDARFALADYDRVEFDRRVTPRRRAKNLAQLSASVPVCVSLADRRRFLARWAADEPAVAADWKAWFRRVAGECRRKIVVRMRPIE